MADDYRGQQSRRAHPSDELREAVIDAALRGDTDEFSAFNDAYSEAQDDGIPVGKRGKKVKMQFGGGKGGRAETYVCETICPDCGVELHMSGVRFIPSDEELATMDDAHRAAFSSSDEEEKRQQLWMHHNFESGCPAYKWRRRVMNGYNFKVFGRQPLRGFFQAGLGYAWRNLRWDHPVERTAYRILKHKEQVGWVLVWWTQRYVGAFEQRRWNKR